MLESWLRTYNIQSEEDFFNARREIVQEIALSGLQRGGFLEKACFYGGTALRIFYGLDRFSENLDFSLLYKDNNFSLSPYCKSILEEFKFLGLDANIQIKTKEKISSIESAFLKETTSWSILKIDIPQHNIGQIKVKIEVDRDPPLGFTTEPKLMYKPFTQYINCMVKEDLFAGKMHAVLFRGWGENIKGRDWYDLVWYIKNKIALGLNHFNIRCKESGQLLDNQLFDRKATVQLLHNKIDNLNLDMALKDIRRFSNNHRELDIWSKEFFHDVIEGLRVI